MIDEINFHCIRDDNKCVIKNVTNHVNVYYLISSLYVLSKDVIYII